MQIKSSTPLIIPDIRTQPIKELLGPRIRTSAELDQLNLAFQFTHYEFKPAKAEYDASITDEDSDENVSEISSGSEEVNTIQPNGMHKPQFVAPAMIVDDEIQGEDLSEVSSESESDDLLDFDQQSQVSDNVEYLEGSQSSFSRQVTCDSDNLGANLFSELESDKRCETMSAYHISTGSPMMLTKTALKTAKKIAQMDPMVGLKFNTPQLVSKAIRPTQQMVLQNLQTPKLATDNSASVQIQIAC